LPAMAAVSGIPDDDIRLTEGQQRLLCVSKRLPAAIAAAEAAGTLAWCVCTKWGQCGYQCGGLLMVMLTMGRYGTRAPTQTANHVPIEPNPNRRADEFDLLEEMYRGKTSYLHRARHRISGALVALKTYRKRKLSVLNK